MVELFPKNDKKDYPNVSDNFKNVVREQRNIETHEMFMITDAMQCQTRYHYETLGHTHSTCGQANPRASGEVEEQNSKHVVNCFKILILQMVCISCVLA